MEAIVVANYTRLRLKLSSLIDSSKRFEHFLNLIYASATFDVGFLESTKFLIQKWIALQSVVNSLEDLRVDASDVNFAKIVDTGGLLENWA